MFFRILLIFSTTLWMLKLAFEGYISMEHAVVALIVITAVIAISGGLGLVKILFFITSLSIFLIIYSDGTKEGMITLLRPLSEIFIILVGIFIMFRAFSKKKD